MSVSNPLFALHGIVTPYDKNGRKLGYPTANITAADDAPDGVFIGIVTRNSQKYEAMVFIGAPITMNNDVRRAEAHMLDFPDQDLYGEELQFELLEKIRPNEKYNSADDLITAIKSDELITRNYFKQHPLAERAS